MKASDIFSYAFGAIRLRKLRAGLTTLGVVIGIAAIVALLSLSQGFQNIVTEQFEIGFATNTLIVSPRSFGVGESAKLYVNDAHIIDAIPNVNASVAIIQRTCYISFSQKTFIINVIGVDFAKYTNIYGSTFSAQNGTIDPNPSSNAIVIGARLHDPWQNGTKLTNINDQIEIIWTTRNTTTFDFENKTHTGHVEAILNEIGGFGFGGPSDLAIYIPISQARAFFGTEECNTIIVQLKSSDEATIAAASDQIRNAFGGQVSVTSSTAILGTVSLIFSSIEIFLAGIAGISLLVAGIGIMNIMIVSLMERTREIGILKALGMKGRTVMLIFLSEAMIIGFMGGAIGVASGWSLANVVARFGFVGGGFQQGQVGNRVAIVASGMSITPVLTPTVFLGAFAFGLIVSVVFGLYPAWRASKLKPVDALRYE